MLKKIHHVGIVVQNADVALGFYRDALGLPVAKDAVLADQGIRGVLLPAGETELELLEPVREGTGIGRFLAERGEGLHHVCFESDDVGAELEAARGKGLRLIDEQPRQGLAGLIGFLHPSATCGALVEFATPPPGAAELPPGATVGGFDLLVAAVADLDAGVQTWSANYGFAVSGRGESQALGIRNANLSVGDGHAYLELVTPLGEHSAVSKFLTERGEGLYLISLEVGDLDAAVATLRQHGARVGDPQGGGTGRLAFVSPRSSHGVSIQLRQRS